jgi:glycosyltransferase involved in cell wall biosynthesis
MKVSIIMPTFNDEKHIALSIQSVANQTHVEWELLIMDDGSVDDTKNIVLGFNDLRIKYFRQENKGQLVALNNLCQYITGDIVLMLHSDDRLYCKDTLEKNLIHFADSKVDGLYGDLQQFFDSAKPDEIVATPKKMDKTAVYKLITLLGSNIIFDHFFVRRDKFEENVRYNYFQYYMPYWLNLTESNVTSLNLKYTDYPWYHYRVYDQNYTNSIIGNFEVYFTRFRSILFLSQYLTVPFPLIQKELLRKYKILGPVFHKKASNNHIAKCYEANIRSMKSRTENAYTDYFEKLVTFYNSGSTRTLILSSEIEISYQSCEARKFYNDQINNTLRPLVAEILNNLTEGFKTILVQNEQEKLILKELLLVLCIRAEIQVLDINSDNRNGIS